MRAGPKRTITAPPLDLSKLPRHRGARAVAFIEKYLKVPRGKGARRRFRVRPWQREIIYGALRPGVRQGLATMPRGQGKTVLCSALATFGLFEGVEGAQVIAVASDQRQADILRRTAARMIELSPELSARAQVFQDRIVVPHTDSVLTALPAEPDALQGWDPTLAVVDELHVVDERVWDAVALAAGKRERSLVLAISTAAGDRDSVMWRLVEHGRAGTDKQFFYVEYAAPEGCEADDEDAWKVAMPALGDFCSIDAVRATYRTTREEVFRRYRLNQWVGQVGSWIPFGAWEQRAAPGRIVDPYEPIVAAFDGSISDDSTALIGCSLDGHLFEIRTWERDEPGWRVPRAEVSEAVDRLFRTYRCLELACDPYHWIESIQDWQAKYGDKVVEWPSNSIPRMAPATDALRSAVMEGRVTHDGSENLARHVGNAVVKSASHGDVVVKDRRGSPRKIDAAVCAIIAFDRARWHAANPPKKYRAMVVV